MKTKTQLTRLLMAALVVAPLLSGALCGCKQTLAPGGPYTDVVLYQADATMANSFDAMKVYVKWEASNHAWVVSKYPEATRVANHIRANAKGWRDSAVALRDAYAGNPTVENRTQLIKVLDVIRAALGEAAQWLTVTAQASAISTQ